MSVRQFPVSILSVLESERGTLQALMKPPQPK